MVVGIASAGERGARSVGAGVMDENETRDDPAPRANPSPWPLAGAALLVGAIVGVVWFALNTPPQQRAAAAAPTEPAAVAAPRDADIARLMRTEPPAAAPVELAENETLVCGQVLPRAALADDRIAQTLHDAGAGEAIERFARTQLADDDHARAVGLALRLYALANHGPAPTAPCEGEAACQTRDAQALAERSAPLLTELAALAANSSDPRAVMLAREQCYVLTSDERPLAHCQALTARRLVALDPGNAAAWLELATEEPAAAAEALHQATLAPRWQTYATASRRFVERVDAKAGVASWAVVQALTALPQSMSASVPQRLMPHCAAAVVAADANRRQQCEQLAQALHDRSTDLMGLFVAGAIGRAIEHPQAAAWRDDARLLAHVEQVQATDPAAQDTLARECAAGLPRDLMRRSAREGEVPALRALMQASGLSEAQWREALAAADAAAAASQKLASASAVAASAPR
jgi:hypothetical protein